MMILKENEAEKKTLYYLLISFLIFMIVLFTAVSLIAPDPIAGAQQRSNASVRP